MKRQATSWQKIIAIYAYLTKDLEPKESADCFFNGKKLEQILDSSERTCEIQQAQKGALKVAATDGDAG